MTEYGEKLVEAAEVWRQIHGLPHEVSSLGRVRRGGKLLRGHDNSHGYLRVDLSANGARRRATVHRLVAEVFLGEIPEGWHVNHKDGNKRNNTAANLEIVSPIQNVRHAVSLGLAPRGDAHWQRRTPEKASRGSQHWCAKLTEADIPAIRRMVAEGIAHRDVAQCFGVSHGTIQAIAARKAWRHV